MFYSYYAVSMLHNVVILELLLTGVDAKPCTLNRGLLLILLMNKARKTLIVAVELLISVYN